MHPNLITIDYLIINLVGNPFKDFPQSSNFKLSYFDYGTKIFKNRAELFYKDEKIGVFTSVPRASIIDAELSQLQFENHLFYTKSLRKLQGILSEFCNETNYNFKAINRLDIALDKNDLNNSYRELHNDILSGKKLISGRGKAIQSHHETYKGVSVLNGFTIGKRSSAKLLRVYNKTLSLQLTDKPYINEYFKNNNLENTNVWRCEFQLNASFFTDFLECSKADVNITQKLTWGIFDTQFLIELFKTAQKGFFEIHYNTGKSQINKEQKFEIFDFENIEKSSKIKPIIKKIKKVFVSSLTIKKRLAKSLFREYYANNQDLCYIIALNHLLEVENVQTQKKLKNWFRTKVFFYLHEFRTKEKIIKTFDTKLYVQHQNLFI
jgi:hypothetical protein